MEEWKKNSIFLVCFTIFCAVFDVVFSYVAFVDDPIFFIAHEANAEAVAFFVYGQFPFVYAFITVVLVVVIFIVMKDMYKKLDRLMIVGLSTVFILSSVNHLFGAMTWFDTGFMMEFLINGNILMIIFIVVIVCLYNIVRFVKVVRKRQYAGSVER